MKLRYNKRRDEMRLVIKDEEVANRSKLDEDVSLGYTKSGEIAEITVHDALERIFESFGVKLPSERKQEGEKAEGVMVRVDADKCLGFGSCVIVAPEVFRLEEKPGRYVFQSQAKLDILDESGGEDFEKLLTAAQSCPTQAIILVDRKTGKQIYPTKE